MPLQPTNIAAGESLSNKMLVRSSDSKSAEVRRQKFSHPDHFYSCKEKKNLEDCFGFIFTEEGSRGRRKEMAVK